MVFQFDEFESKGWAISISAALAEHRFGTLFSEHLGWERGTGSNAFTVRGKSWSVEVVACKRGLQVCWCRTDRHTLLNRYLIRDIHVGLTKLVHENILILSCDAPRKQVWAWTIRGAEGGKLRHREHPFFSHTPPPVLLQRIAGLAFTLEEEESAGLTDALNRVRSALDTDPAFELFVKKPAYAVRSDTLAEAMRAGDPAAFHRFILLHRPLALAGSKWLSRWFGLSPEDAEQIGILGLIQAARRFDPARGLQFSTYAMWWIRQAGQRSGPTAALLVQLPSYVLWPCIRHSFTLNTVRTESGPDGVERKQREFEATDPTLAKRWPFYVQARRIESLAERETWRRAATIRDNVSAPDARLTREQVATRVRAAVERLHPRYAEIVRRRFGIGCAEETLIGIGNEMNVTRERIRQLEAKGLAWLRDWLADLVPDWWLDSESADDQISTDKSFVDCLT